MSVSPGIVSSPGLGAGVSPAGVSPLGAGAGVSPLGAGAGVSPVGDPVGSSIRGSALVPLTEAGTSAPISVNALETTPLSTPLSVNSFPTASLSVGLPAFFHAFINVDASTLLPVMPNNSLS